MKIGVPKEIKLGEKRVGLTPHGVASLVALGHEVIFEYDAGLGSGFTNEDYVEAGATGRHYHEMIWRECKLIIKVKEPLECEWQYIRRDHIIFTYFHFAANLALTNAMIKSEAVCIAYETVEASSGELLLLTPMSEIAGKLAAQEGAKYLESAYGGRGVLLGGTTGVPPAKVVVIGGGIVGVNAARIAAGLGAFVTILDTSLTRLRYLADTMPANVATRFSNRNAILEEIASADLVIGAVLVRGAKAPMLIRKEDLSLMKKGAVLVDVAVDQGGCIETMHPTTHEDPVFIVDGIVHYGVANIPGAVPRTATIALTNATLPYVLEIANKGWEHALKENASLLAGLNIVHGMITYRSVAESFKKEYITANEVLATNLHALEEWGEDSPL